MSCLTTEPWGVNISLVNIGTPFGIPSFVGVLSLCLLK